MGSGWVRVPFLGLGSGSGIKNFWVFPLGFWFFSTKVSKSQAGFWYGYHFLGLGRVRVSKKSGFSLGFGVFGYSTTSLITGLAKFCGIQFALILLCWSPFALICTYTLVAGAKDINIFMSMVPPIMAKV